MWYLLNIKTGKQFYLLQDKVKYSVSRNAGAGDLILSGDTSISRSHAFIHPHKDHITIVDTNSKYGTFVNENIEKNIRIENNTTIKLISGNKIRFGQMENIWRVEDIPLYTFSSSLPIESKKSLLNALAVLNAKLETEWTEQSTHLTMETITITVKVLQALNGAIPIVTPLFWKSMYKAAQEGLALPEPDKFQPNITEPYISKDASFAVNINRRRLFTGKMFIFMIKKQMEHFKLAITLGGGTCKSLEEQKVQKSSLLKANVCVIEYSPLSQSQTSQDISRISEYLHSKNLRTIPDCEIGLAIAHCSMVKFCNPKYKIDDFIIAEVQPTTSKILVQGTASNNVEQIPMNIEVPETILSEHDVAAKKSIASNLNADCVLILDSEQTIENPIMNNKNVGKENEHQIIMLADKSKDSKTNKQMSAQCSKRKEPDFSPDLKHPNKKQALEKSSESASKTKESLTDSSDIFLQDTEPFVKEKIDLLENPVCKKQPTNETIPSGQSKRKQSELANKLEPLKKKSNVDQVIEIVGTPQLTESDTVFSGNIQSSASWLSKRKLTPRIVPVNKPLPEPSTSKTNKRPHNLLKNTDDDDDSDDNCFQFDKNPSLKKSKQTIDTSREQFSLSSSGQQSQANAPMQRSTQQILVSQEPSKKKKNLFNVSIQPVKIDLDKWISFSVKKELNITEDRPLTTKALDDLDESGDKKEPWNKIMVVFNHMTLVNRSVNRTSDKTASNNGSQATEGSIKNFKAFTKKMNYRPQRMILKPSIMPVTT